jgi:hypothetical protein
VTEIVRSPDCGNSPKNLFAQETAVALATGDLEFILDHIDDDVDWRIAGRERLRGKTALANRLRDVPEPAALTVHHVMTHGKVGSVNGTMIFPGGRTREFCDVYEFTNARGNAIRTITSYIIEGIQNGG